MAFVLFYLILVNLFHSAGQAKLTQFAIRFVFGEDKRGACFAQSHLRTKTIKSGGKRLVRLQVKANKCHAKNARREGERFLKCFLTSKP